MRLRQIRYTASRGNVTGLPASQVAACIALQSSDSSQLMHIRRADVGLAVWWRGPPVAITPAEVDEVVSMRFTADADTVAAHILAMLRQQVARP